MSVLRRLKQAGAFPVFAVFFAEAFVLGNWIPRIPDIKEQFGMSASDLGFVLLAISAGTLVSFTFSGWLVRKWGLRIANMTGNPLWAVCIGLAPWMPNFSALFAIMFSAGIAVGVQEVAMNTAAEDVTDRKGIEIMSRSHGFWSLGSLAGALVGAGFALMRLETAQHFLIVMPIAILLSLVSGSLIANKSVSEETESGGLPFKLPSPSIFLLCLMPIGIMLVEGAFIDWSAVFVKSVLKGGPLAIGLIYAAFSLVMAITRLSGDTLIERFGPLRVARFSALSAMFGIALFALAPNTIIAFIAAAFSGLGVAICYPVAVSAAARRPGNAEDNVAAISMFAFTSFMVAPPLIGFAADTFGLRSALLCIVPIAATSYVLSTELVSKQAHHGQGNSD